MGKETLMGRYKIKVCDTCGSVEENCCECEDKKDYYSLEYIKKLINDIESPDYYTILRNSTRDFSSFKSGTYYGINYILNQIKDKL